MSRTHDLENFATKVDRVVNKTRRRSSLLTTPTTVDASWLFTIRRSTVTLQLNHTSMCCGFVLLTCCSSSAQDFNRHGASRGPSALAQLTVESMADGVRVLCSVVSVPRCVFVCRTSFHAPETSTSRRITTCTLIIHHSFTASKLKPSFSAANPSHNVAFIFLLLQD